MTELYWLQRIGCINEIANIIIVLSCLVLVIVSIIYFISMTDCGSVDITDVSKKIMKKLVALIVCCLPIAVFVPSTSELYTIYGIGGTIDYIKSNDTAKQLPDKVVEALDAWVDNYINNNEKEE